MMTFLIVAALLAFFAQQLYVKMNMYATPMDKAKWASVDFKYGKIPTTYYRGGKIADVLPEWDHSFHLYRLHENENVTFDISNAESLVRAKALSEHCRWNSAVCTPCFDKLKVTEVTTTKIFSEPGWYASFAKISDSAVELLWNTLKLPFDVSTAELEHAFISNLEKPMVTAGLHANPLTSSMAIQFIGRKTWLFFAPETYLGLMEASPAAPILLPQRAPSKPYEVFVYTSEPGDVLFFTESWAHIVLTYDGPNVMVNYRNFNIFNILRQPLTWFAGTINGFASPVIHNGGQVAGGAGQQVAVPEKEINMIAYDGLNTLCSDGKQTGFDLDMMKVFEDEMAKYRK